MPLVGKTFCSFCGKTDAEVRAVIVGPAVYICNECVELCNDVLRFQIAGLTVAPSAEAESLLAAWESSLPCGPCCDLEVL
jgi:ATP-dependent protease Clp ATPase subunit